MPEAHGVGLGDFNLVSEDLPLSEIVAADLDAGVAFVPAKFKAKNKVGGLAAAPDEPVLVFGGSRTPDLAVTDFPGARFAVPAPEIAVVENGNEAGFVIRGVEEHGSEWVGKDDEEKVFVHEGDLTDLGLRNGARLALSAERLMNDCYIGAIPRSSSPDDLIGIVHGRSF